MYRDHLSLLLKWVVFVTDVPMSSSHVCHAVALPYQVYILQVHCQSLKHADCNCFTKGQASKM